MRYVAVVKASHQYLRGMDAWASKVKPISTMWRCFLSTMPFFSLVWGQGCRNSISLFFRIEANDLNSPPQSLWIIFIFLSNLFSTRVWYWRKAFKASDFFFKGKIWANLVKLVSKLLAHPHCVSDGQLDKCWSHIWEHRRCYCQPYYSRYCYYYFLNQSYFYPSLWEPSFYRAYSKARRQENMLWRKMVLAVLKEQRLDGYVLGTKTIPAENISSSEGGVDSTTPNPAYEKWVTMDQTLLGWLYGSMTPAVASEIINFSTSREVWKALEDLNRSTNKARKQQL